MLKYINRFLYFFEKQCIITGILRAPPEQHVCGLFSLALLIKRKMSKAGKKHFINAVDGDENGEGGGGSWGGN